MTQTLTVGLLKNSTNTPFVDVVHQTLRAAEINVLIQYFDNQDAIQKAVVEGTIQTYACPLNLAPLTLPLGLVIAALSERKSAQNCLVTKNTEGGVIQKVLTNSDINRALMQYLNPDYVVETADLRPNESLEALNVGRFDAVILPEFDTARTEGLHIQPFSVREFTPPAGQGVACFIAAEDDLPTRRLLKNAHHPSVSLLTNIERTVQKTLKDYSVNAYCERDRMGNYHLWAAALVNGELRKTRLSQSTTFGMAEKVCDQLLSA